MNKRIIVLTVLVVILAIIIGTVYFIEARKASEVPFVPLSRPVASEQIAKDAQINYVVTSSKTVKWGEVFGMTAICGGDGAQKVVIKVDNKVIKTCEQKVKQCSVSAGPFEKKDIGKHKYEVAVTNGAGIVEVYGGDFTVIKDEADAPSTKEAPAQSTPAPAPSGTPTTPSSGGSGTGGGAQPATPVYPKIELESLVSSSSFVDIGQVFSTTITFKKTVAIDEIIFYVDNYKFKVCEDSFSCGIVLGPMNNADIGIHAYKIIAHAISGETKVYESSFKVLAPKSEPTPAQPTDTQAPTVKIETSKTVVMADSTVGFKASADDASGIKKISVAFGDKIVKECFGVKECYYVAGPFENITQDTKMIYGATAIDNAGNSLSTGAQYVTVKPAAQIVEPTVTIDSSNEAIYASQSSTFVVSINSGSKKLDYVESYVAGELAEICNGSCTFSIGPFTPWAGETISYYAKAYFTDGSSKLSASKSMSIIAEPTIMSSISPNQRSVYAYETLQISSFVDSQGLDVFTNDIYVNGIKKMSCLDSKCFYSERASVMLGYEPQTNVTLTYYSQASLSNGKTIKSAVASITIMPGQAPQ